jgi:large conductance mechanosensitive channel
VNYGLFINTLISFIIIAFSVFLLIRGMNRVIREEEKAPPPPAPPTKDQQLLAEIRDLLKARA